MKIFTSIAVVIAALIFLTGCTKNETHYYQDNNAAGLSIFSNTGNNTFSCFIDGSAWRTVDRTSGGILSRNVYEVQIRKQFFDSLTDVLSITWEGYYVSDKNNSGDISLNLYVPKNFSYNDFSAMQGKRLIIDSTNGYFLAALGANDVRGTGTIYFNTANLIANSVSGNGGSMSGLLEADFGSFQLTSGRFDHNLDAIQIFFN